MGISLPEGRPKRRSGQGVPKAAPLHDGEHLVTDGAGVVLVKQFWGAISYKVLGSRQ